MKNVINKFEINEQDVYFNNPDVIEYQLQWTDGKYYSKYGYYVNNTNASYSQKIKLSKGTAILVSTFALSFDIALCIVFDNDNNIIQYSSLRQSDFIYNATSDVYIMINIFKAYKDKTKLYITKDDTFNNMQLKEIEKNDFIDYALIINQLPILNTIDKTFTLPTNTRILGSGIDITLKNDIIFTRDEAMGSAYLVLNAVTLETRIINSGDIMKLLNCEVVIAYVRWSSNIIYQGNFEKYYINDENNIAILKEVKRDNVEYEGYNPIFAKNNQVSEYYVLLSINVGDSVKYVEQQTHANSTFFNYHLCLNVGDILIISGKGSSNASRLYAIVDYNTKICEMIAEPGEDHSNDIFIYKAEKPIEVWGTMISKTGFIGVNRTYSQFNTFDSQFIDYLYTVPTNDKSLLPVINTAEKTITFKKNTQFFGTIKIVLLNEDVTLTIQDENFGSYYIIMNSNGEFRRESAINYPTLSSNEGVVCVARPTGILNSNLNAYYLNDKLIILKDNTLLEDESENELNTNLIVAPCMFNPKLDLSKNELRVLDIGNSYTEDSTHYLANLVSSANIDTKDMCFVTATRGGASFKHWCDIYNDKDTSSYGVTKKFGGLDVNISGTSVANNGEKFRNTLINNKFDLIMIHQVSTYAPYYDRWNEDGPAGYLNELIRIIRKHQPNATIGFLLVHSYWSGYSSNTEKSSYERWKLIAESAKKLRANYGIDFIVPYGTAIQNIRSSSLNTDHDLTNDGTHCADGLGDYTAACCYFQSLIAPRYGVSVLNNPYRVNITPSGTYPESVVSVTDENAYIAQKAAFLACYNWYECINPENIDL